MSFATYTSRPVLFVASVGGVALGVTLLLLPWKDISFGKGRSSHPFLATRRMPDDLKKTPLEEQGSCRVVEHEEFNAVINKLSDSSKHIAISCKNKGDKGDDILVENWIALFPRNLFKGELRKDQEFFISTVTEEILRSEEERELFKTRFSSEEFLQKEVEGKWTYDSLGITEKEIVDIVTLEGKYSSEKIYFVHGHQDSAKP